MIFDCQTVIELKIKMTEWLSLLLKRVCLIGLISVIKIKKHVFVNCHEKEQYDDTLARELFDLLIEHQERLHGELTSYLAEFDIQE